MFFESERSRDKYVSAVEFFKSVFSDVNDMVDAEYLSADRSRVVGISSLPVFAPICNFVLGEKAVLDFIDSLEGNVNFVYGDHVTVNGQAVSGEIDSIIKEAVKYAMAGVGYLNEKGEHVIDLKGAFVGTHYTVNLLLGCRVGFEKPMITTPKAALDAFGRGAFRASAHTQVLASRCVMNPEEAGEPANRQFYITENNQQIFYSADANTNVKSAICTHKPNHTVIEYETECGLKITRKIFIVPQYEGMPEATEAQIIKVENLSGRERKLRIVATGSLGVCDSATVMGDIMYGNITHESGVIMRDGKVIAISPASNPMYAKKHRRFATMLVNGETMDEYCACYNEFVGRGTLNNPQNVARLNSRPNRKNVAFFAMAKSFVLGDGEAAHVDSFVGYTYNEEGDALPQLDSMLKVLFDRYADTTQSERDLQDVIDFYRGYSSYLVLGTEDEKLNAYVNNNLPFQVLYQSFLSRSFAWTQKSFRMIGFREIQDMYPSLYYLAAMGNAPLAKEMISQWVQNVYEDGYANHNFYWEGNGAGDASDDQLWLMQAVYRYVSLTGDVGFLSEEYPIAGSDKKRTVFETMWAAVFYSGKIAVGKHHLPVLDHIDWNDCLKLDNDSISAPLRMELYRKQIEEKGQEWGVPFETHSCESVMNAFLLKVAEDNLAEMAEMMGNKEKAEELRKMSEELLSNIQAHAWKENFFARCLINNPAKGPYTYVGAKNDGLSRNPDFDGSYFLNCFSWSILSNSATEEQIKAMLVPLNNCIRTDAGFLLSSPCDLGKISRTTAEDHYYYGDRENGAVFKHATMMATAAMFKAAKMVKDKDLAAELSEMAFWMLDRVFPYKTLENPFVIKSNPRFCTQYNNSETLEGIGPMLSGTASWLTLTVFEFLGIGYTDGGLTFSPVLRADMTSVEYEVKRGGTTFAVKVTKPLGFARVDENTEYYFDGEKCTSLIPDPADKKKHIVEIKLK